MFTKPVDEEEVPDYREIIKEPMDLETMMTKIDQHQYESAQEFLQDIDLICNNALEYNPDRNPEDKIIRHRACTLRDTAYAYIKAEMDTDFEYKCRDIRDGRKKRYSNKIKPSAPNFILVASKDSQPEDSQITHKLGSVSEPATPACNIAQIKNQRSKSDGYRRKKRKSSWARGEIKQPKRKRILEKDDKKDKDDTDAKVENGDDEAKKMTDEDDGDRSEEDVSVHSTDNSDGLEIHRQDSEINRMVSHNQINVESEVALYNGHLSTEDSHDSMRVTSAVEELAAKASACKLTKDIQDDTDDRSLDATAETEDSVVSSSEQGGGTVTEKNGIIIDWNHLEVVYESCISATDGAMVDDLLRLYTSISSLIKKHSVSVDRTHLLQ
ncbi:ATPase AAA domain-containing protein 2, partial [Halocaridina rubra]